MLVIGQPLCFDDTTGVIYDTDLDDIYDRMFFKVIQQVISPQRSIVCIYDRGRRSSRRMGEMITTPPAIVLEFGNGGHSLGTISVGKMPPLYMKDYLRKIGTFGSSLNRKFVASDSNEYRWLRGAVQGQTWTCFNSFNQIVAHYTIRDTSTNPSHHFRKEKNSFIVEEPLLEISVELLATLIIMRHIEKFRL